MLGRKTLGMKMNEITIQEFTTLNEEVLELLLSLEEKIFETPLSREVLLRELVSRPNLHILVAFVGEEPAGYKIGFEYHSDHEYFYSWNGGVIAEFRRQGIARALMEEQHRWAKANGFRYIRTQTKNKYRNMLLLNIRFGFDVTGVYKKIREKHHGIVLEKEL